MAARGLGRIARLTLFSGPQCSLCDRLTSWLTPRFSLQTAKAELAKVRQQRPFELNTINIQDPGQERWKKKYVYWIPALHIEGKEVAKGRWDAQTGPVLPRLRVHEVEEWRRERLEWLDKFEPGQIRGPLLREALGLEDGDPGERVPWLPIIAMWGYPPGWVGPRDPREHVWKRIQEGLQVDDEDESEDDSFYIFAEGEPELCQLSGDGQADSRSRMPPTPDKHESDEASAASVESSARWAAYPDTYFLPSKLPIYTGQSLPALRGNPRSQLAVNKTHTADREALWQRIASPQDQSRPFDARCIQRNVATPSATNVASSPSAPAAKFRSAALAS
ncbi:hypothetical protein BD311DRAFT_734686 [Dichomitus squalens]|uniref:PSP proline-rich domain-containing protein n=1 Tax=Dichomitus squalens TaxID=114155 RepID=A0A4Q9N5B7_9APHY|nr:hypothetical protein BD311DRAFT_734686 [Dichomitus squalens]